MTDHNGLPQASRKPDLLGWVISHGTAVIALLGLTTYGLLRLNYSIFYGRLGVTPEDVGLSYATTLSQSIVGLLLLLVVVSFSLTIAFSVFSFAFLSGPLAKIFGALFDTKDKGTTKPQQSKAATRQSSTTRRGFSIAARLLLALLMLVILYIAIRSALVPVEGRLNLYGVAALLSLVLLSTRQILDFARSVALGKMLTEFWQIYKRPLLYILVTAVVLLLLWLPTQAIGEAAKVRQGQASHTSLFGIPLLSWGGDTAVLTWLDGNPPNNLDLGRTRCLIYLGEADSTTVLYDVSNQHPVRLPSGKVGISLNSNDSACR